MSTVKNLASEKLAALVDASAAINSAENLDETLAAIAGAAATVMHTEAASVIMLDKVRKKQVFRAAVGDCADQLIGMEYDQDAGISGMVLRTGRDTIVDDVTSERTHFKEIDMISGFHTRNVLAAPLINKGETLGVVEVLNAAGAKRFDDEDRQLVLVFANLAAIAVANSQLRDRLRKDNRGLRQSLKAPDEMIGLSPSMKNVKELIRRVAASSATVLMLGETGTGKEVAARLIHSNSPRCERPFIPVNCAALPRTLLESELFGHEAGAFTGATERKLGRFELAEGGTIFLDEIAEVAPDIQVKLLRVLQDKEITRIGGVASIGCDVRIIAATNRKLDEEMRTGGFRQDLYFRLNVFPIEMPPLRSCRQDIPLLVEQFLRHMGDEMKLPTPTISQDALSALGQYDFPGNIRELQNVLERACLLCCGPDMPPDNLLCILAEHLPRDLFPTPAEAAGKSAPGESALAAGEKAMIVGALTANNWNQSKAAKALGVSRDNIRYRMKKHDIKRPK
jgi:transcriptional regulator with GAF, ATPase, and Fis domain